MPKTPQVYTNEFKRNAVRLIQTSGKSMSEIARDLGIATTNLHRWRRQNFQKEDFPFLEDNVRATQDEVLRLKIEIEILKQERNALKKAVTIFSREH